MLKEGQLPKKESYILLDNLENLVLKYDVDWTCNRLSNI